MLTCALLLVLKGGRSRMGQNKGGMCRNVEGWNRGIPTCMHPGDVCCGWEQNPYVSVDSPEIHRTFVLG